LNLVLRQVEKPQRWDQPFSSEMDDAAVDRLLQIEPFRSMRSEAFPPQLPLREILRNDCRIRECQPSELVIRQGDYGNSAFLILEGRLLAALRLRDPEAFQSPLPPRKNWFQSIAQLWNQSRFPEVRKLRDPSERPFTIEQTDRQARVFLQDIPGTLELDGSQVLEVGTIFGELSALSRSPRTATVVSQSAAKLLEIRWQGLRDLMKFDPALRQRIDQLYRDNGLYNHLQQTPLLEHLSPGEIEQVAAQTDFQSYGEYLWTSTFRKAAEADVAARIQQEPVIVQQGEYVNDLVLIRGGFVRVTRLHGEGEQTIEYLGKGQVFGLRELVHNWKTGEQRPWQLSLRAVGYVDILRIPVKVVEQLILPRLNAKQLPSPLPPVTSAKEKDSPQRRLAKREPLPETKLLESIVEHRLMNGTQAMVIDLNRCTRCDDCVRACAATHDGNPRFVREGVVLDQWMFASACMHCQDPVCMIGCPTGAIAREGSTGVIAINEQTCIGCGTCANSCPYGSIKMVAIHDPAGQPMVEKTNGLPVLQATKCNLCIDQSGGPACQRACPHDALIRIDLTHPAEFTQWTAR
jgi:Fe-S-cluster-containing dehydrogenase component/CRP-like cAMP-binding protein